MIRVEFIESDVVANMSGVSAAASLATKIQDRTLRAERVDVQQLKTWASGYNAGANAIVVFYDPEPFVDEEPSNEQKFLELELMWDEYCEKTGHPKSNPNETDMNRDCEMFKAGARYTRGEIKP